MTRSTKIILFSLALAVSVGLVLTWFLKPRVDVRWDGLMQPPAEPAEAVAITACAQQFQWTIWYPGADGEYGATDLRWIDPQNIIGLDRNDPRAHDDLLVQDAFHLPVDREVDMRIRSRDVLHAVYIPHLRVRMDAIPGMDTRFAFTPTRTTAEMRRDTAVRRALARQDDADPDKDASSSAFDFMLACNEVCGRGHFGMRIKLVVETEEEYKAWLAQQPTVAAALNW